MNPAVSPERQQELRTDPLSGQQVILARARLQRPHSLSLARNRSLAPVTRRSCPFCPGNEHETPPAILTLPADARGGSWSLRVVPNLFAIVSGTAAKMVGEQSAARQVTGSHEVVIETPDHGKDLPDRDENEVGVYLGVLQQRLQELLEKSAVRYVSVFKNRGLEAGASLEHPHSQIVALDFLPEVVRRRVRLARRHLKSNATCVVCSMLTREQQDGTRVVAGSEGLVTLAPYASVSAGETLIIPTRHAASFTTASEALIADLARALRTLLRGMRDVWGDPAYNFALETAPARDLTDPALHWYLRLTPRLARTGGFEMGTGVLVNSLDPNDVAAMLRDAM
jgi:UDPglucose--hexose-1-phosphate uridylyltransferase